MALLSPIASYTLTQKFGPSALSVEPHMYGSATKANFNPEAGLTYFNHFHPALDMAAPSGTAIVASEAGKVVFSGWDPNGAGYSVKVQIKPNVFYCNNHCSKLYVAYGATVARGQRIANVGMTGLASGNHDHFWVRIDELVNGALRQNYYNPILFLPGGALQNDARIAPPTVTHYVQINDAALPNIRSAPNLDLSSIYAVTKSDGIYRLGVKIAAHDVKMTFGGWVDGAGYTWAKSYLGGGWRFIAKPYIHIL